jgi:aspartyl-tRNA(Asn)/glutamyl-tRNA(Gln) amidotransferase subunit C
MCHELNGILGWIEQLNEVDVTGVAPLTGAANTGSANTGSANTGSANTGSANTGSAGMAMAMRADVVTDGGYADKVLSNAPERIGDFYVVPKVVE